MLKETRLKSKSGISRFEKEIEASINEGIPLLWTVTVGIYEEPMRLPQSRGGHMRMIIGYNKAKREIIFSDSWIVAMCKFPKKCIVFLDIGCPIFLQ